MVAVVLHGRLAVLVVVVVVVVRERRSAAHVDIVVLVRLVLERALLDRALRRDGALALGRGRAGDRRDLPRLHEREAVEVRVAAYARAVLVDQAEPSPCARKRASNGDARQRRARRDAGESGERRQTEITTREVGRRDGKDGRGVVTSERGRAVRTARHQSRARLAQRGVRGGARGTNDAPAYPWHSGARVTPPSIAPLRGRRLIARPATPKRRPSPSVSRLQ